MSDTEAFINNMPKAELHIHIEGTLEPQMRLDIARRNGIAQEFDTVESLASSYQFKDLAGFLRLYFGGIEVLQTSRDFFDVTYAYLERVSKDNVVYCEMHFDPQAHTVRGVGFKEVISGIHDAQLKARKAFGIRSELILGIVRDMSPASAMATLDEATNYKDWIIGVGLDSTEKDNPPIKFKHVFKRARDEGYRITMHCDHDQDDSIEHIRQCIEDIGVDRIDHGYNSLEEENISNEIVRLGIPLTFCLTSNPSTPGYPRRAVELKEALARGISVSVNTDDPAYMLSYYMNEVFSNVQRELSLPFDQLIQLSRNSFEGSWLPRDEKDFYLSLLDSYVEKNNLV